MSDAEFLAELLSSELMPRLSAEDVARLKALLSVSIRLSDWQRDPTLADDHSRLKAILRFNLNLAVDTTPVEGDDGAADTRPDPVAVAVTMKVNNPGLSLRAIAAKVKMSHVTLSRNPVWKAACNRLKATTGGRVARGRVDEGTLDAEFDRD